jgi:hypothetical protein
MKDMTEYLVDVQDSYQLTTKLCRLCTTMCELATIILEMETYNVQGSASLAAIQNDSTTGLPSPIERIRSTYLATGPSAIADQFGNQISPQNSEWTQAQADSLWELVISDPTTQWLETDFSAFT